MIEFDAHRFSSSKNFFWSDKKKENSMIVEKSIDPRVDGGVTVRSKFDNFGWGPLWIVGENL